MVIFYLNISLLKFNSYIIILQDLWDFYKLFLFLSLLICAPDLVENFYDISSEFR